MELDQLQFFELDKPCPKEILNCESVREQYKRERDDLLARGACGGCMDRALRNKYITLISALIQK